MKPMMMSTLIGLLIILFIPQFSGAAGNDYHKGNRSIQKQLEAFAQAEQQDFEQRGLLLQNQDLTEYLTKVTEKLRTGAASSRPGLRVLVLKHTSEDAFVYPNGICYLSTGLLTCLDNEDQLAMAIAHEMVHYLQQHSLRAYYQSRPSLQIGLSNPHERVSSEDQKKERPLPKMLISAELEADREGLWLLAAAGYRSSEALGLMKHLITISEKTAGGAIDHPAVRATLNRRIEALTSALAEAKPSDGKPSVPVAEGTRFRHLLAPAFLANARAAITNENWGLAKENIDHYLMVDSKDPKAYYLLGEILWQKSRDPNNQKALDFFRRAIALNTQYAPPYRAMGLMHLKAGRTGKARDYLETYLALIPGADERLYIQQYLNLCEK